MHYCMPKLGHYQSSHKKSAVQEKFDVVSISFLLLLGTAPFTKLQDAEKPILREVSIGIPSSFQITQFSYF